MKLTFLGADHEVTGSCHFLEIGDKKICVDCGMEQGADVYENQEIPVNASDIDYVFVTHAHIDHTGLLPLLYARGFRGAIYATKATTDLCSIMLRDCAHIQMFEAEWRNRKAKRAGGEPYVPMYTMEDAMGASALFVACPYNALIKVCDEVTIRFSDIGHLLGSASIEVFANENGTKRTIVFSGDIGNINQPLLRDPSITEEADYVVMESTYGDRYHGDTPDYVGTLSKIIDDTFAKGGNVVIPAFAVGRTQELLYFIRKIKADKLVKTIPDFDVYVDSPLAVEATSIFNRNVSSCFDEEAMELVKKGINPINFHNLKLSITSDDSKAINFDETPKVILSASGMCEAGRIRHHLKHNLWRAQSTIVFVGYQAHGTLGRALLEGAETVKLFGEPIEVKAKIMQMDGVSGHADKKELINWVTSFKRKPSEVFVVHGEDLVTTSFAQCLTDQYGIKAEAPYSGAVFDLVKGVWEYVAEPVAVSKKDRAQAKVRDVYERLKNAGQRLLGIIRKNEGLNNKDMAKFADQINALCDKWDR